MGATSRGMRSFLSNKISSSCMLTVSSTRRTSSYNCRRREFSRSILTRGATRLLKEGFSEDVVAPRRFFSVMPCMVCGVRRPLKSTSTVMFALKYGTATRRTGVYCSKRNSSRFFNNCGVCEGTRHCNRGLGGFCIKGAGVVGRSRGRGVLGGCSPSMLPVRLAQKVCRRARNLSPLAGVSSMSVRV